MARDIKGKQTQQTGVRGEISVHPLPSVLPGERGGQWTIVEKPEAPATDLIGKTMYIDPSDTPAGRRGRAHEFHHAAYTEPRVWDEARQDGTVNDTVVQKVEDAHIQIRAEASGFQGYEERIYRAADFAESVINGANPERLGLAVVAMIGTADFQPMASAVEDVARYGEASGKLDPDLARRYINGVELARMVDAIMRKAHADGGLNTAKAVTIAKAVSKRLAQSEVEDVKFSPRPQPVEQPEDDEDSNEVQDDDMDQDQDEDEDWTQAEEALPSEEPEAEAVRPEPGTEQGDDGEEEQDDGEEEQGDDGEEEQDDGEEEPQDGPQEDDEDEDQEDLDDDDGQEEPTEEPEAENSEQPAGSGDQPELPREQASSQADDEDDHQEDLDDDEDGEASDQESSSQADEDSSCQDDGDGDSSGSGTSGPSPKQIEDPSQQIDLEAAEDFLGDSAADDYQGKGWQAHGLNDRAMEEGIPDLADLTTKEQQIADKALQAIMNTIRVADDAARTWGAHETTTARRHGHQLAENERPGPGEDIYKSGRWFSFCPVTANTQEVPDFQAAMQGSHAAREAIKRTRKLAEIRKGRALSLAWGDMAIQRPKLPKRWPGQWKKARPSFSDHGCVPQAMHRLLIDGKVFNDHAQRGGRPTILVDLSGSMSLSAKQVEDVARAHPYATIATYSGGSNVGVLRIIVDRGNVAKACYFGSPCGGQNTVDGPALRWLSQQAAPRIWVSDGGIFGAGNRGGRGSADTINADVRDTLRTASIKQLCDPDSVTPYLKECSAKGKVFLRRPRRVKDEAVDGSLTGEEIHDRAKYYSQFNDEGPAY